MVATKSSGEDVHSSAGSSIATLPVSAVSCTHPMCENRITIDCEKCGAHMCADHSSGIVCLTCADKDSPPCVAEEVTVSLGTSRIDDRNLHLLGCDMESCSADIFDKCETCGASVCERHYSGTDSICVDCSDLKENAEGNDAKEALSEAAQTETPCQRSLFFDDIPGEQQMSIGGVNRSFTRIEKDHVDPKYFYKFDCALVKELLGLFPLLYHYRFAGAFENAHRTVVSLSAMTNPVQPGVTIEVIVILQTQCGKFHYLVKHNGNLSIEHGYPNHSPLLQGFVFDNTIAVDAKALTESAKEFFHNHGPYGKVSDIKDPAKRYSWIYQAHLGAPLRTKNPFAFANYVHPQEIDGSDNSPRNSTDNETESMVSGSSGGSSMKSHTFQDGGNRVATYVDNDVFSHKYGNVLVYVKYSVGTKSNKFEISSGSVFQVRGKSADNLLDRFVFCCVLVIMKKKKPQVYRIM